MLLAIQYMIIVVFTGGRRRRIYVVSYCYLSIMHVSPLYVASIMRVTSLLSGAPTWLYICNQARVLQES